jgi:hypothetical protein
MIASATSAAVAQRVDDLVRQPSLIEEHDAGPSSRGGRSCPRGEVWACFLREPIDLDIVSARRAIAVDLGGTG